MSSDEIGRKEKVGSAHRSVVTRLLSKISELLEECSPDVTQLEQKKMALIEKSEILKGLDSQLLEVAEDEWLEAEIKQSDVIQEKVKLVVLELERIKTKCESPKKRVLLESVRVTRSTTPSRSPTPTGETTQSTLTNPRTEDPSTISSTTVSGDTKQSTQVKLPKLTLRDFNGDLTMWTTFWESFESAVHRNPSLSNIDKFNYLNSLLDRSAADAIVGLLLTFSNYEEAIDILKQRSETSS